jgi:ABC-2 type transport system ATP-binding protein
VRLSISEAREAIPELFRRLDAEGVAIRGLTMSEPTMADVFLRYTGREIRTEAADQPIELGWWV